jgi:RHS repeat-associated protein
MTRKDKAARRTRWASPVVLILTGFAACLSGDADENGEEPHAVAASGGREAGGAKTAAVTLPAGDIVDTETNSGWTEGSFSVNHDGAAEYNLPLWVPAGRRGFQPSIGLHYNSQSGNGPAGVGWSVTGFSTMAPCPRTIAQDGRNEAVSFSSADVYCLDGMRLRPKGSSSSGQQEYRTERESFARVISYTTSTVPGAQPDYFKAWTKDGQIRTYGQNGSAISGSLLSGIQPENPALQRDPNSAVAAWSLNRMEDRNGNAVDIAYERIETSSNMWSVEMRPTTLTYGPDRKVELVYETRPDPIDGFRPTSRGGFHTTLSQRLQTIKMSAGAQLLREYRLTYRSDTITSRSLLTSVTECDGAVPAVCMNPLQFTWSGPTDYEFGVIETDITDVGTSLASGFQFLIGDIDADGTADIIYSDQNDHLKMRFSNGSSLVAAQDTGVPNLDAAGSLYRRPIRTVDYNRDGRIDLVTEVPSTTNANRKVFALYRSNGASFVRVGSGDFDTSCPMTGDTSRCVFGGYFADVDGNGLPDYLTPSIDRNQNGDPVSLTWRYRLNNVSGLGALITTAVKTPLDLATDPFDGKHQIRVTSFDGLRPAFLAGNEPAGTYEMITWQTGIVRSPAPNLPFAKLPENEDGRNLHFADINCDGLADAIYPASGLAVQLNTGSGFTQIIRGPAEYARPHALLFDLDLPVRVVDFNNDGCTDVLIAQPGRPTSPADFEHGFQVYTWRNGGFQRTAIMNVATPTDTEEAPGFTFQSLDYSGDGVADIAQVRPNGHLQLLPRHGDHPDRLVGVSVAGLGDRVGITYTNLANPLIHERGTCTLPLICPVQGASIVLRHRLANAKSEGPLQPFHFFEHRYRRARADLLAGWLGFEEHEIRDLEPTPVPFAITFFDNTTSKTVTTPDGSYRMYPFAHLPKRIEYHVDDPAPGGTVTSYVGTSFVGLSFHAGSVLGTYLVQRDVKIDNETESYRGAPATNLHGRLTTFEQYDGFGNPQKITTTAAGIADVAELTYRNDETNWLLGLPTERTVTSCATVSGNQECQTRTGTFDYEDNGNLKGIVVEPLDDSLKLTTTIEYGSFGNASAVTTSGTVDASGTAQDRRFSFAYDSQDLFVKTATNPAGHVSDVVTHASLGVPLEYKDPNLVPRTMKYDGFGRLREVNYADGYFERFTTNGPLEHRTTIPDGAGGTLLGDQFVYDIVGREVLHTTPSFNGRSGVSTIYDRRGRVSQVSRPFADGETPSFWTKYTYDNRNRILSIIAPDNATVSNQYTGLETHMSDAMGTESVTVERVDGRIAASQEDDPESTAWLQTSFDYGPFGAVRKVTAVDGTLQTFDYDRLGRPKRHVDPSTGTSSVDYNAFGEPIEQVNGANERTVISYDILGRVTVVTSPDGSMTNDWDAAALGKGKLQRSTSPNGVVASYTYNDKGQTASQKWVIETVPYQVNLAYDSIGRLDTITYPDIPGPEGRLKAKYNYTLTGYLETVTDATSGTPYWRVNDRNAAGQLTKETYGQRAFDSLSYEASTGALQSIDRYAPDGQWLRNLTYTYDPSRNVTSRSDENEVGGAISKQLYGYDSLHRLTGWTLQTSDGTSGLGNEFTTTFDYSKNGNIDSETTTGRTGRNVTYQYGQLGASPHALTSRNGQSYTYDLAGRQKTGPGRTITYTAFNLPKVITSGGQSTNFVYDSGGSRVLKRNNNLATITVAGLFERRVASAQVENIHYIIADGRAVAEITKVQAAPTGPVTQPSEVLYLHDDVQGNVVQTTDANGQVKDRLFYDPFGRRTDGNYNYLGPQQRPIRRGYSGHEHDDELDLINMQGRVYDPTARHFLTPDPFIQAPLFTQSYNRYSYAWNNPATLTDPSGFSICEIELCIWSGGPSNGGTGLDGGGGHGTSPGSWPGDRSPAGDGNDPITWPSGTSPSDIPGHVGGVGSTVTTHPDCGQGPFGSCSPPPDHQPPPGGDHGGADDKGPTEPTPPTGTGSGGSGGGTTWDPPGLSCGDDSCMGQLDPAGYETADDFARGFVEGTADVFGRLAHPINLALDAAYVAMNPAEAAYDVISGTFGAISAAIRADDARAMGRIAGSVGTQVLLTLAIEAGIGGAPRGSGGGGYLVRFGKGPESAEALAAAAARAEANGFPHGVSTKLQERASAGAQHRVAPRALVEQHFKVEQTGRNPAHHTIHLPNPVTDGIADLFNSIFRPKE